MTNDALAYFDLLKTSATTPSGAPKDKFHFTYNTADWIALSGSGQELGYGIDWEVVTPTPPRACTSATWSPVRPLRRRASSAA